MPEKTLGDINKLLQAHRLEAVHNFFGHTQTVPDHQKIDHQVALLENHAEKERDSGDIRKSRRLVRRAGALEIFKDHGLDPDKLIARTDLPDHYEGKILLLSISAGSVKGLICLRSGDDWHREILRNTEEEIRDLGFETATVDPAGGAAIRLARNGDIVIFGSSDDYGSCDKKMAARLIAGAFPGKMVRIDQLFIHP
jgi:hypothetical protein